MVKEKNHTHTMDQNNDSNEILSTIIKLIKYI